MMFLRKDLVQRNGLRNVCTIACLFGFACFVFACVLIFVFLCCFLVVVFCFYTFCFVLHDLFDGLLHGVVAWSRGRVDVCCTCCL